MTTTRIPLLLSLAATAAWTAKAFAIAAAGGLGRSPLEGPFFLAGLALAVVATAVSGAALVRRRRLLVRVVGAVAELVGVSLLATLAQLVVTAAQPAHPGWVWGELNLWVIAVVLVGVNLIALRPRRPAAAPERLPSSPRASHATAMGGTVSASSPAAARATRAASANVGLWSWLSRLRS
jgi:hypothetical protein